jgi:hypothetical protein
VSDEAAGVPLVADESEVPVSDELLESGVVFDPVPVDVPVPLSEQSGATASLVPVSTYASEM